MDNFSTPKINMESTVFFTPPSSLEKDSQTDDANSPPLIPVPVFSLLTPTRDFLKSQEQLDFISFLFPSYSHLSDEILSHLNPFDLCQCLSVCKMWRQAILSNKKLFKRIIECRKQHKMDNENFHRHIRSSWSSVPPSTPRPALGSIDSNFSIIESTDTLQSKAKRMLKSGTLRPCPKCSSPAKKLNKSRAQCNVCQFDFCPKCFRSSHGSECPGRSSPKKKREEETIIGSKKNKKRIKRL